MAPRRADSVEPRRNASMYESLAVGRHTVLQPRKTLPWRAPHDLKERLSTVARQTFGKGGLRTPPRITLDPPKRSRLLAPDPCAIVRRVMKCLFRRWPCPITLRGALPSAPRPLKPSAFLYSRSPDYLGDLAVEIMRIAIPMRPQKTNHRGL